MERKMQCENGADRRHPTINMRQDDARATAGRALGVAASVFLALTVAACSSGGHKVSGSKVDSKYGVVASPRLVASGKKVPRGGGRYMVGKPYKIAGKTYRPREDRNYRKVGMASWYGEAFHGRQTANGEIFDMTRLSAAHTTMPLPSYARVTNVDNGRSVIVRVNDRGPFHGNREIDLSKKVANVLDFKGAGLTKVKVEYVGRARLDGRDDSFLEASYRGPGSVAPGGSYPGTQLAQLDRLPPGAVVGQAPTPAGRPGGYENPAPVLAAYEPAAQPPAGRRAPSWPQRHAQSAGQPRNLGFARAGQGSLDDDILGFSGYGQESFGNKYGLQSFHSSQGGTSYVSNAPDLSNAVGTHAPPASTGPKPLNLRVADSLGYAPSYAPESRIAKAFLAIGQLVR